MNCADFRRSMRAYMEGQLPGNQLADCREHESACDECAPLMARARELCCSEFVDLLADYLDEDLPADRATVFEGHVEICSECAAYVDSYQTTVALARACEEVDALPDDVSDDLVKAILTAREQG